MQVQCSAGAMAEIHFGEGLRDRVLQPSPYHSGLMAALRVFTSVTTQVLPQNLSGSQPSPAYTETPAGFGI